MAATEQIAFVEFCRRQELSPGMRRAFEMSLREQGQPFNYRTEVEWDRALQLFHAADRRRRS